jgi:hypothetical protein
VAVFKGETERRITLGCGQSPNRQALAEPYVLSVKDEEEKK